MKLKILTSILLVCVSSSPLHAESPATQKSAEKKNNVQGGEFALETAAKKKDPYSVAQSAAIAFLEGLKNKIPQLTSGNVSLAEKASPEALHFLGGLYLYCSVKEGTCPMVLDSLLEADIINARVSNSDECLNLRQFWKTYIGNDLENRHKYLTKIGYLSLTSEFNTKSRPKYVKCKETVKAELTNKASNAEYFKARYSDGSKVAAVTKSLDLIAQLKAKDTNVFAEVGAGH